MNLGETIKKLRRQKDMTQEQLAEYLNISTQAVSRWETNASLPDITLIPMLANIFDTSADVLLGIDITSKEKRIDAIKKQSVEYLMSGQFRKAVELLREGLREYPNSYKTMQSLMSSMFSLRHEHEDITDVEKGEIDKEIITFGEKILAECTDDECRYSALQILCYTYPNVGELEKALKLAETMPGVYVSKNKLLSNIYSGNKRFSFMQDRLVEDLTLVFSDMATNNAPLDDGSNPYTTEERIVIFKKIIAIIKIIFEKGGYGWFDRTMASTYTDISIFSAMTEDYDGATEYLNLAAEYSVKYDEEWTPNQNYSDKEYEALLFRGGKYGGIAYNKTITESMQQLDEMKNSAFDPIRERKEFIEIEEKLKVHAEKR